jgi:hypothetical protein
MRNAAAKARTKMGTNERQLDADASPRAEVP